MRNDSRPVGRLSIYAGHLTATVRIRISVLVRIFLIWRIASKSGTLGGADPTMTMSELIPTPSQRPAVQLSKANVLPAGGAKRVRYFPSAEAGSKACCATPGDVLSSTARIMRSAGLALSRSSHGSVSSTPTRASFLVRSPRSWSINAPGTDSRSSPSPSLRRGRDASYQ